MNQQQVIDEARPMLTEVLGQIGLLSAGVPLDLDALRGPFSIWVQTQEAADTDLAFSISLVDAFISERFYLNNSSCVDFINPCHCSCLR